jgi:hypothetical protein
VTRRAGALTPAWAAAAALAAAATLLACGEKEERLQGTSRAEVRALVAAGLTAVGSDAAPSAIAFNANGRVLRIRIAAPADGSPLLRLIGSFRSVHADIEPFCPKPALLRCRPALRAWASPRSRTAAARSAGALRRLAAQTYAQRPLVRHHNRVTRIVTANGELLGAVRTAGPTVMLSFGGLDPPHGRPNVAAGGLEIEVGARALAAMRPDLPPPARRALAGVRRLVVSAPLPKTRREP